MLKGLFITGVIALLVITGVKLGQGAGKVVKDQECRSEIQYMNLYTDGTSEYKTHADRFFSLGCDPKEYK